MTVVDRSHVVSSFMAIKGTMLEETYAVFERWDFAVSKNENLNRLREQNYIGATSGTWLRDVAKVLNRRYEPATRDRALVVLAQGGCPIDEWRPIAPALLVLGDMSVQGNIKPMRSLTEPLQVARDNGAKRALIPIENKRNFLDVPADVVEYVDPIFYGDPKTAAMKVFGLT